MVLASIIVNVVALLGMFLLGTNFAFIFEAQYLFPVQTCRFWRVFFLGKSLLTGLISYEVYLYKGPVTWTIYVLFAGIMLSLAALWVIWYERPYKGILPENVVPSADQTIIVKGREKRRREK